MRGAAAAFADLDIERGDLQRLEAELAGKGSGKVGVSADVTRLDARAIRLEADVAEGDEARQGAARAFDRERAAALALCAREDPAQARFRGEEPAERHGRGNDEHRQDSGGAEEEALPQKLYPTEKCRRQSEFSAP